MSLDITQKQAASSALTAEIVNPVIVAAVETFEMMMECNASRKSMRLKEPNETFSPVTAIIGLSGTASGSICLSFERDTALRTVKHMLDMDVTEMSGIVSDTVGEFANVIVGCAKDKLKHMELEMGLPNIVTGDNVHIDFPTNSNPICIHFESDMGPFMICCGFVSKA